MNPKVRYRVESVAIYMISTHDTIREVAKSFGVSRSTVHNDLRIRLPLIRSDLAEKVDIILKDHKDNRHIIGGQATREKIQKLRGVS